MKAPERLHTSKPRGGLKLAVALIPSLGTVHVQTLTGTTAKMLKPAVRYQTKRGLGARGLASGEYEGFMKSVLAMLKGQGPHIILHDRAPSHVGAGVQSLIKQAGHDCFPLPPRSPDLDPLDYGVFGHAKSWLAREMPPGVASWGELCAAFTSHLKRLDPVKQVGGFVGRLEKVIASQGGPIEGPC
jgi:hypothetical protein